MLSRKTKYGIKALTYLALNQGVNPTSWGRRSPSVKAYALVVIPTRWALIHKLILAPEPTLFDHVYFGIMSQIFLLTESCGEGVTSGLTETEWDSNLDMRRRILMPTSPLPA